ncbi:O-antigen translocase [Edwardsiella tarda]|uniref:O-antigen translocase n=1 Tax=Edwardsiella tarda TaxID=636 RepID=UPI00351C533E
MKRLLKVTAMTGMLTLLKMAIGFVVAKVIAVYTGPTGMAMMGQVQSMIGSLNGVINAPASSGVVRFTAEYSKQGIKSCSPWWQAALHWILILLAIIIPIGLLLSEDISVWLFKTPELAWIVIISVCALPLSAIGTLCNSVINGLQQYRRYVILGMLSTLVSGGGMLFMIIIDNINGGLFAISIQSALIGGVMLIVNFKQPWFKLRYWWGGQNKQARKEIAGYMFMAITSALTIPVSLIIVRNILIDNVGWVKAGQWQAVWKISEVYLGVITMALGTYFLPKLSSISGVNSIISEINKTARIIMPLVIAMALIIYFFRDLAISLLFSDAFRDARDLFLIQLVADVVKIASWLYAYPMLSRGRTKIYILFEVLFSAQLVVLTYFFVLSVGVQGANLAYLINYSIYFIVVYFNVKKISI